jgi:hypothetical protein
VTGQHPFADQSEQVSLVAISQRDAPSISQRRPGVPAALDAIVNRLLAKRPYERYDHPAELIADLRAI